MGYPGRGQAGRLPLQSGQVRSWSCLLGKTRGSVRCVQRTLEAYAQRPSWPDWLRFLVACILYAPFLIINDYRKQGTPPFTPTLLVSWWSALHVETIWFCSAFTALSRATSLRAPLRRRMCSRT